MARRKNQFLAERVFLSVQHAAATDADSISYAMVVPPGRTFRLERAYYCSQAGLAEDATDAINFKVTNGAVVMANFNTDSDGEALDDSLAADTPQALTLSSTDADLIAVAGDVIRCTADESGTTNPTFGTFLLEGTLY